MEAAVAVVLMGCSILLMVLLAASYTGTRLGSKMLEAISRQPEAAPALSINFMIGMAMVEIFLLIAFGFSGWMLYAGLKKL